MNVVNSHQINTECPFQAYFLYLHLPYSRSSGMVWGCITQVLSYSVELIFTIQLFDDIKTTSSCFQNYVERSSQSNDIDVSLLKTQTVKV